MGHWFGLCLVYIWECNELVVVPILCVDVGSVGGYRMASISHSVCHSNCYRRFWNVILCEAIADVGHTCNRIGA